MTDWGLESIPSTGYQRIYRGEFEFDLCYCDTGIKLDTPKLAPTSKLEAGSPAITEKGFYLVRLAMARLSTCQWLLAGWILIVALWIGWLFQSLAEQVAVQVVNESAFRVDIYLDDGAFGRIVATGIESHGGTALVHSFQGSRLLVTRHGVREGLFDPHETTKQHFFQVPFGKAKGQLQQAREGAMVFVIPSNAAPSKDPCQDRYPICPSEAANRGCESNPGWMIVQLSLIHI